MVLFIFFVWLTLSASFSPLYIALGIFSDIATLSLIRRPHRLFAQDNTNPLTTRQILTFLPTLAKEIITSSLTTARTIISPSLSIQPSFSTITPPSDQPSRQALLANAITLTPGTLTVHTSQDSFLIHSLSTSFETHTLHKQISSL